MEKSVPDNMASRTYHVLTAKTGVCDDYAIAFVVIARYIGIEFFVRTGYFEMEYYYSIPYHHGWIWDCWRASRPFPFAET